MAQGPIPLLYIGGVGRSGSTLVERVLNEAPEVHAMGETHHLWERGITADQLCGCGIGEPTGRGRRHR